MSEPKVKRIDRNASKFTANGKTYFIQRELSLARYVEFLKMQHEIAFGVDLRGMYNTLNTIFETVTKGNDVLNAIAVIRETSYNQINAVVDFIQRDHPTVLRFCALFINGEHEDIGKWDERVVEQKIEDWITEGFEIDDFFFLAGSYDPTFKEMLINSSKGKNSGSANLQRKNSTSDGST